ncbi:hypothetical protein RRG08_015815 [Elysia crispata]|uniref:Membrane-associated protein n=1 Tax=Elysia crispata TaxID=231223 RepID=A0AAE1DQR6_9GAST|nr:hypothetical protein RRG08_015815 [Elysia crispata]
MFKANLPVLVVCLAAQVVKTHGIQDGRQYDLLTPSIFGFDVKVHLGAQAGGGVEQVTGFNTGTATDTQSSTVASSITVSDALFSLLSSSCNVYAKIQFISGTSMDGYLPLPVTSQGTAFVVSTWNTGTSYIAIRCGSQSATLTINIPTNASPSTSVTVSGATLTPGDSISVQVSSNQELLVTSAGFALDGVQILSTQPISLWAGNKDATVLGIGQITTLVEMFPPSNYFSNTYIVQIPAGLMLSMLKVIALASGTTVTQTSTGGVVTSNTLATAGDVWTISQIGTVQLVGTAPIIVTQYLPAAGGSNYASMTLILSTNKWLSSYLVYGLNSHSSGSQVACIAILTTQVWQLTATRLTDGTDITYLLTFTSFSSTAYSTAILTLTDSSVIYLQTTDGSYFQVVQYGGISDSGGAYAFPTGALVTCNESIPTSTSSSTTSTKASRIVSFLPDLALFAIAAVSALVVLGVTAEAVRRWKLGIPMKTLNQDSTKTVDKGSAVSRPYSGYCSDEASFKKPCMTIIGNSTVPFHEDGPKSHHFRSKAPTDSSYIQILDSSSKVTKGRESFPRLRSGDIFATVLGKTVQVGRLGNATQALWLTQYHHLDRCHWAGYRDPSMSASAPTL